MPQGGQDLFLGMPSSSCHRRVLLLGKEDHVAGRFLKRPLALFSGFGSANVSARKFSSWTVSVWGAYALFWRSRKSKLGHA